MIAAIFLSFALLSFGQEPDGQGRRQLPTQQPTPSPQVTASPSTSPGAQTSSQQPQRRPQEQPSPTPEEVPVVTHHEIRAGGRTLRYTATAGMMPIKNRDGETEARIFFMAYTLDEGGPGNNRRPLTFSFNGGPGSASVWLHLGALGPRRVPMNPDG